MKNSKKTVNCWAEISSSVILDNKHKIESFLDENCKLCCVVKADAYGHGAINIAKLLEKDGVDYFAVANMMEAIELRKNKIKSPILVLGYTNPQNAKALIKNNITQTCFSYEYANQLSKYLDDNDQLKIHIKVNTGMNRLGFNAYSDSNAINEIILISKKKNFVIEGIFTHFFDYSDMNATYQQYDRFKKFTKALEEKGVSFAIKHCCNSGATISYPNMHDDMVRVGAFLYGINVSDKLSNQEAICLKARISQIFNIDSGDIIGYGATFKAQHKMTIATISAGYADGILRSNSNKLSICINGHFCKILGSICMDQFMVDISDIDCKVNDEVIVYGRGGTSFDDVAKLNDTISYEIMCNIGKRVKRFYR